MSYKEIDFENDTIAWVAHGEQRDRTIIDGFYKSAELVAEMIENKQSIGVYEDSIVYPFMHLVRHTYELTLKRLLNKIISFVERYKKDFVLIDEQSCRKILHKHSLEPLLEKIKEYLPQIDGRTCELGSDLSVIEKTISDFVSDKGIDNFRYVNDKNGNEFLKSLNHISITKAISDLKSFRQSSEIIDDELIFLFDEYSLGTYFKKLSRKDIFDIANILPLYKDWGEDRLSAAKRKIEIEYNLTSQDFFKVLDIIKGHREFSYYIGFGRETDAGFRDLILNMFDLSAKSNNYVLTRIVENKTSNKIDLVGVRSRHKELEKQIRKYSKEKIQLLFTIYNMGHNDSKSEHFRFVMNQVVENQIVLFDDGEISYIGGKIISQAFVRYVLIGLSNAGMYEVFIEVYRHVKDNYPGMIPAELKIDYDTYERTLLDVTNKII